MSKKENIKMILRKFKISDANMLYQALKGERVARHMATEGLTLNDCQKIIDESIEHWKTHNIGSWAVVDDNSDKIIGWAGFKLWQKNEYEILIVLSPETWGAGRKLLNDLLQKAKNEYKLKSVYILLPQTRKSFRLIKKLDFELMGKETFCGQLFFKFVKRL